jgi:hypothetical protein
MNNAFEHLAGLGAIKAWLTAHLPFLREGGSLAPRAIVLTGLPGTGKHSVSRAIAANIGRPMLPFTCLEAIDPASILLVEDLGREHLPLIRRPPTRLKSCPSSSPSRKGPGNFPRDYCGRTRSKRSGTSTSPT